MKLSTLVHHLNSVETYNFCNTDITGIANDSRKIRPGYLYVAIKGYKTDGHNFIKESIECGAQAIVSEEVFPLNAKIPHIIVRNARKALSSLSCCFYNNPSQKINVVGVTGTNGKTTTTFLTKSIIEKAGYETGLIGTINYQIGRNVVPAQETTPESVELQRLIAEMAAAKMRFAVMEVSSHSAMQYRIENVNFKTAVFTNISAEHMDYHKTISNYLNAKVELFKNLKKDSFAVLNADDKYSEYFADRTRAKILWYGIKNNADIKADIGKESTSNIMIMLNYAGREMDVKIPFVGLHNVYNVLASAASAVSLGFELDAIKSGIETAPVIPGRLENVPCDLGFRVVVDYAHTPHALETVLHALRNLVKGRVLLVFGCGGDRDKEKRPEMGRIADENSDIFWITNDNPRSEDPVNIIDDITVGIKSGRALHIQTDRYKAIEEALSEAKDDDLLLIAGKGHEKYQIIKDTIIPFDDRVVAMKILSEKSDKKSCK
ncbi:UDP-N-acetylmuramyl-tripeptide synthase [Candidatus Scalindua japonica]|uniref:UDP-N-acetylmuramoyl-L-alanyl-D-glutamate--2,6-diaminopimelate ligase n=1 Tax=Candidatus Scalindua japonica TaxID=1284222 RepID=A0A286U1U2_9BACT|nr:UDP-N-acetylmuramoyl-L-alanyl-D-glutamate--2,6-diaminopimelate ligase [Candidatus Scalindua japonica]GAX62085.1 UDP-N-acetylmuramyl-tripeptide synthase [Candidatus Scalindua japonica]